jgi:hypothetical protein
MTKVKALCNDFSEPELPHSDLNLPTPTLRPAVVSPHVAHCLEGVIA